MIDAKEFAKAGQKYLGTPYSTMDCQTFVERCMADCGLKRDLKGSNAWYREMDWVGTPEECKKIFGSIPTGAMLFIWSDDGGEVARGYKDGLGNASHIGIVTHTGKGAIHSSSSRGCVAESEFHDKTIRNGGWNRIGLSRLFDYGDKTNQALSGAEEVTIEMEYATVITENGYPVKLRPTKSTSRPWLTQIPNRSAWNAVMLRHFWQHSSRHWEVSPMSDAVIVALITGACAIVAQLVISHTGNQKLMDQIEHQSAMDDAKLDAKIEKHIAVVDTKIEELTREVREHNNFARRMPVVEEKVSQLEKQINRKE